MQKQNDIQNYIHTATKTVRRSLLSAGTHYKGIYTHLTCWAVIYSVFLLLFVSLVLSYQRAEFENKVKTVQG